jgi:hypothetical protein
MKQLKPGDTLTIKVLRNGVLMDGWAFTDHESREMLRDLFGMLTEMLADLVLTETKFRGKEY